MSDKETAPWIKKAAAEIVRMVANQKHEPDCEVCIDVVEEIIAETFAGECTAPAPLYRRDEDGTISVVNEAATPPVTPWKSHFTDSDVTGDIHNYVDTGDGKRLWAQDADEIVKRHNEQAPQVTPTHRCVVGDV
jgi:hypothetical protein